MGTVLPFDSKCYNVLCSIERLVKGNSNVHDPSTAFSAVEKNASLIDPDRDPFLPIVVCND